MPCTGVSPVLSQAATAFLKPQNEEDESLRVTLQNNMSIFADEWVALLLHAIGPWQKMRTSSD